MPNNNRVLLLLSGGLDSATLLHRLRADGMVLEALFFNIAQSAVAEERRAVQAVCDGAGLEHLEISLVDWRNRLPRPIEMLVMPRNLTFAMLAVPYARVLSCDSIALGSTQDDVSVSDSNQEAVDGFNRLLETLGQPMRLIAPWLKMEYTKVAISSWALTNVGEAFVNSTRSCYAAGEPCGKCSACRNRIKALEQAKA